MERGEEEEKGRGEQFSQFLPAAKGRRRRQRYIRFRQKKKKERKYCWEVQLCFGPVIVKATDCSTVLFLCTTNPEELGEEKGKPKTASSSCLARRA